MSVVNGVPGAIYGAAFVCVYVVYLGPFMCIVCVLAHTFTSPPMGPLNGAPHTHKESPLPQLSNQCPASHVKYKFCFDIFHPTYRYAGPHQSGGHLKCNAVKVEAVCRRRIASHCPAKQLEEAFLLYIYNTMSGRA